MLLDGKSVIVTGGSTGIGAAIVRLFASEGARVAFSARSHQPGGEVEADLRAEGHDVVFWTCDSADETQAREFVGRTVDRHGGLDILVNNAAVSHVSTIEKMTLAAWNEVMTNNLTSVFLMCREAIPHLRRSNSASIVNLGSTYSFVGAAESGAYAMTKAGAVSLTKTLALELAADRIRVNALCPGATVTPLYHKWLDSQPDAAIAKAELYGKHPLGRIGTPEDMAHAALYLASDRAGFVTGHSLLVDGGYTVP
jgi:NAD(P)-dependent dehydrogenase (short-subunit alcohol dehydrogenase family)